MNNINFDSFIDDLAESVPEMPETYIAADGLKHCSACGGAVQCVVEFNGIKKTVPCICECDKARRQNEENERQAAGLARRVNYLRNAGFHDEIMQEWTFANDNGTNPRIFEALKRYVANFNEFYNDGRGLLIYGSIGTGKTYGAACVANALIDKGVSVYMTNFSRIINELQDSFDRRQSKLDKLNHFDMLVIDDLGAERSTDYTNEIIYSVIDGRYRIGKPLIITTNLLMSDFKNPPNVATARIYDRILEKCFPVEMNGESQRRKKITEEYNIVKNMLGL